MDTRPRHFAKLPFLDPVPALQKIRRVELQIAAPGSSGDHLSPSAKRLRTNGLKPAREARDGLFCRRCRGAVENPTMRNDSIFGVTDAGVVGAVSVASEDIGLFEVRQFSLLRTIGLGYLALSLLMGIGCSFGTCDL